MKSYTVLEHYKNSAFTTAIESSSVWRKCLAKIYVWYYDF